MAVLLLSHEAFRIQELAELIEAEFREMPGMQLTFAQVKRLWNLTHHDCTEVLDYLLKADLLCRDRQERYQLRL